MTTTLQNSPNPFALMTEPEVIFAAMAASDRLARLKSRICRPLDKPLPLQGNGEAAAFDAALDSVAEEASA